MFKSIDEVWEKHDVSRLIAGYQTAERSTLVAVTKEVKKGLKNLDSIARIPRAEIRNLGRLRPPPIERMIREVEAQTRRQIAKEIGVPLVRSDRQISTASIGRITEEIEKARRNAQSLYRRSLSDALSGVLNDPTGITAQRALNRIADRGLRVTGDRESLTGFVARSVRKALSDAALGTYTMVMEENGLDLVMVSNKSAECPLCKPWEGKVLSVTGADTEHPSLDTAKSAGLFHPNCRHSIQVFAGVPAREPEEKGDKERGENAASIARRKDRDIRLKAVDLAL